MAVKQTVDSLEDLADHYKAKAETERNNAKEFKAAPRRLRAEIRAEAFDEVAELLANTTIEE